MCIPFAIPNHSPPNRPANKIDSFALYCSLHDIAAAKTDGRGYEDGTSCSFSMREVEKALHEQRVGDHDMQEAAEYCRRIKLLELKDDGFHLTLEGLSSYICMCKHPKSS